MGILETCAWLEASSLGTKITESEWMFPTIETVHVLALTLVVGTIAMVDLRLLGVSARRIGAVQLSREMLPWTWIAFLIAAITGTLMFVSAATKYYANVPFRIKMVLLALAGLNMVVLHFGAWRRVSNWDMVFPAPGAVRTAAGLSLAFWIGVVVAGRWIGFV
ncbi:DUF6644 family protein [Sphingomonas bacterium]|uniref:DUF6644 family protein n=1 Tax=Sphingomonas bacterium TaxID=1895847 RepID=UPI00157625D9|nr:DUF6644 family protein [Sphingomonas bacterium]